MFYQSHLRKEQLAKMGQATYRSQFREDEMLQDKSKSKSKLPATDRSQQEREMRGALQVTKAKLENYLKAEEERYNDVIPTLAKVIGDRERVALLKMVMDNSTNPFIINSTTKNTADVFLKGKNVIKMENMVYLLRMFLLSPKDKPYLVILRESLLKWVELSKEEDFIKLLWVFCFKMLRSLHRMSSVRSVPCKNLLHLLSWFNTKNGNQFYFDNPSIHHEVTMWQAQDMVRVQELNQEQAVVKVKKFMEEARTRVIRQEEEVLHIQVSYTQYIHIWLREGLKKKIYILNFPWMEEGVGSGPNIFCNS